VQRRAVPALLIGMTIFLTAFGTRPVTAASQSSGTKLAITVMKTLTVKGRAPKTGYSRAQFGPAWADVDHNGCDTRNDILRRDLTSIVYRASSCVILAGILHDPYGGKVIHFVRGVKTSPAVQIDHVVPLSDAWQKGAFAWTIAKRTAFANDPLELLAVDGPLNGQKSDSDAASWLPPNKSFRCAYVARQVAVKSKYSVWVTAAEAAAFGRILVKCPKQILPTG
jgi:hypothetical protein